MKKQCDVTRDYFDKISKDIERLETTRGGGDQKSRILRRHSLWTAPYYKIKMA